MAKEYNINSKSHSINLDPLPWKEVSEGEGPGFQKYDIKPVNESWIQKSKCSDEEIQHLLPLILDLIYLHQKARKIGLLGLYDNLDTVKNPFYKKALNYILEYYPAHLIDTILTNLINNGNFSGKELKEKMLIKDGVLSIAIGNSPENARELLFSILNPHADQSILDLALEKWEKEKSEYFGEEEIQKIKNLLEFRKKEE